MQLLTEINGYMFEHVKRMSKALNDPIESCTFLERMDVSGPSLLCLYSLSELTQEWNKLCTLKIWMAMLVSTFFFFLSFFFFFFFSPHFGGLADCPTFDANIKVMTNSAQSCFSMITCTLWGTTWQTLPLTFVLSQNKVKENFIVSSKIQLLKVCPVCLPPPPPPPPTLQTSHTHNCCSRYRRRWQCVPMGDNMCRERWHILATKYASTTGAFFFSSVCPVFHEELQCLSMHENGN